MGSSDTGFSTSGALIAMMIFMLVLIAVFPTNSGKKGKRHKESSKYGKDTEAYTKEELSYRKEREKRRKERLKCLEDFQNEYDVILPKGTTVHRQVELQGYSRSNNGEFVLKYPEWVFAKSDGTRDRRTNDISIHINKSILLIGNWRVEVENPFYTYCLVLDLRSKGYAIDYCEEEIKKHNTLSNAFLEEMSIQTLDGIIEEFEPSPTDFEHYCASLFRKAGWKVEVTPPVRDGGYDLKLFDSKGALFLAECKCYAPKHKVGRSVLQKLKGASALKNSEGLLVITTSSFTGDARKYAEEVGMVLIDGIALMELRSEALGEKEKVGDYHTLTGADILGNIPYDMRNLYIASRNVLSNHLEDYKKTCSI